MTDELEIIEITVDESGAGQRLDAFVASATPFSRNAVQRLIESGDLTLNGAETQGKKKLKAGDIIQLAPPPPAITETVPQDIPIDIVYQEIGRAHV